MLMVDLEEFDGEFNLKEYIEEDGGIEDFGGDDEDIESGAINAGEKLFMMAASGRNED